MTFSRLLLNLAAWSARRLPMPIKKQIYRIDPLARLLRRSLNRAAPTGLTTVNVASGALEGCLLQLDLQSEKDYWLGVYEPELQSSLAELVRPGMIVYDVGANIGYISLQLALRVGEAGRVFAFEALPANLERLRVNLALNRFEQRVTVIASAVVEATREVQFLVGPSSGMGKVDGSAGRREVQYASSLTVSGVSLDDFVFHQGRPAPQLVKIDIEGGEVLAMPGMRRVLNEAHPILLMELHGPDSAAAAWQELAAVGYRVCRIEKGFPVVRSLEGLDWKSYLAAFPAAVSQPIRVGENEAIRRRAPSS